MSPDRKLSRRPGRASAALVGLWALCGVARAQPPDAGPSADDLVRDAERAEREPDFARADTLYRRTLDRAPGSRAARRARVRLEWMEERRDDRLGWGPLETLARARRADLDPAALEALAAEVERMPPGRVKREATLLLAESWRRRGATDRAIPYYEALLAAPGITPPEERLATVALAEARAASGDGARAVAELDDAGLGDTFEARDLRLAERRQARRGWVIGLLAVALVLLVGAGAPWRVGRAGLARALAPRRLLAVAYVVGVPAAIAELYERGTGESFLLLGAAVLPVLALAALGGESLRARDAGRARWLIVSLGAVVAPFAAGYLVLEQQGGLASFGL